MPIANAATTPDPRGYTQLSEEEDEPEENSVTRAALQPVSAQFGITQVSSALNSDCKACDCVMMLQPQVFTALQKRLKEAATARPAGNAGVVISLTIGTGESAELWQIDTRAGVPPDCVVTQIEGQARQVGAMTVDCSNASADLSNAAVRVHIPEPSDLVAMLERRLPPFRALAQRRLVLSGDLSQLRAMAWLFGSGGDSDASSRAVHVRTLRTDASNGHGEYVLRVEEGAVSWLISRRWSELKTMCHELELLYGKGSGTLDLQLPAVAVSYRSSTSSTTLARRAREMDDLLGAFKPPRSHTPSITLDLTLDLTTTFALYHHVTLSASPVVTQPSCFGCCRARLARAKARQHWCDSYGQSRATPH